jgi:hypothetical protein
MAVTMTKAPGLDHSSLDIGKKKNLRTFLQPRQLLWRDHECLPLGSSCAEGTVPKASVFRGGPLGDDWIMRTLTS